MAGRSVNYFELYPGDYLRDTTRLKLVEHGAYLRLLMAYYSEEEPLPADDAELFVIVSAVSAIDKDAVRKVADRFFPVGEDGMRHNNRADEEIAKARRRIETAQANGGKGGRPKKPKQNPAHNPNETQEKPSGFSVGSENPPFSKPKQNPAETHSGEASPHATRHTPHEVGSTSVGEVPRTREAPRADRPPKPIPPNAAACVAMREAGAVRVNPSHPTLLAGIAEGATPAMYGDAVREAIDSGKGEPFAYAIATVRSRLADAKRQPIQENRHGPRHASSAVAETLAAIQRRRDREAATAPIEHDAG